MASSSTSTSDSPNNDYVSDVFISHRGPDVKKTLATYLYHRLCKHDLRFLDQWKLLPGDTIKPQLESAIKTSTSDSPNNDYVFDVFISHRGPDVKKTLATDLYHRLCKHDLRVFLDQWELRAGDTIKPQLESAIKTSSVHIAIFSPGYAYSKWCLDELVLMVDCMSKYKSTIIPVFYGVQPAALRWTQGGKGVYAQALCELQEKKNVDGQPRYDSNILEQWRKALSDVAEIKGFDGETYNR